MKPGDQIQVSAVAKNGFKRITVPDSVPEIERMLGFLKADLSRVQTLAERHAAETKAAIEGLHTAMEHLRETPTEMWWGYVSTNRDFTKRHLSEMLSGLVPGRFDIRPNDKGLWRVIFETKEAGVIPKLHGLELVMEGPLSQFVADQLAPFPWPYPTTSCDPTIKG